MLSHLACALMLCAASLAAIEEFGVTYDFSGGRLGDCLLSYLHAKALAHKKGIPLFYRSFPYSSQLKLSSLEPSYMNLGPGPRMRVYYWGPGNHYPHLHLPLFYICPYFPEDSWELAHTKRVDGIPWLAFEVDWKDPSFRQVVKEMVAPKQPLKLVLPPEGSLGIAVHVREGGGYDGEDRFDIWPLKFPPIWFYTDALRMALQACPERPIYCFIFTDAKEPELIEQRIREAIGPYPHVTLDCRRRDNAHSANVLEDFFSLFHYSILIRPQSNFSLVPSLIHDFALVYSLEIDEAKALHIKVEQNEALLQELWR